MTMREIPVVVTVPRPARHGDAMSRIIVGFFWTVGAVLALFVLSFLCERILESYLGSIPAWMKKFGMEGIGSNEAAARSAFGDQFGGLSAFLVLRSTRDSKRCHCPNCTA